MRENVGPVANLRVLELGEFVSAPWCGKLFSSMGAEVVKVEPPGRGDRARRAGPFPGDDPHPEKSGLFLYLNTDKLGITLDVSTPTGRRLFLELAGRVDVVVDNHRPQELRNWGLAYEDLKATAPRVVVTSITPFGWDGPWSRYKGGELVGFSSGGVAYETPNAYVTDPEREPPVKGGEYQAEMAAGWTAASATLPAVRHQRLFGTGQLVDISVQEALANLLRPNIPGWTYAANPRASRHKVGPRWIWACKDGYITLLFAADHHWANLKRMLGNPEWAESELFATREGRVENGDAIEALLEEELRRHTKQELFELAQSHHIPCFPVNTVAETMAAPQYEHRGYWQEVTHPVAGTHRYPGSPYRFSATPAVTRGPAPLLGQDNERVFCGRLGYSRAELRDLYVAGVI